MELSTQERLKDLRVERGLTLEQLADLRLSDDMGESKRTTNRKFAVR